MFEIVAVDEESLTAEIRLNGTQRRVTSNLIGIIHKPDFFEHMVRELLAEELVDSQGL